MYISRCPNCGKGKDAGTMSMPSSIPIFECNECGKKFCIFCATDMCLLRLTPSFLFLKEKRNKAEDRIQAIASSI